MTPLICGFQKNLSSPKIALRQILLSSPYEMRKLII